jgi:hypothetical protein
MVSTTSVHKQKFDFDMWSELSKKDPQAFEAMRQKALQDFIGSVPESKQHRLRCLQWKVDKVRENQKTPLAACVAISDMMWDSLERLNQLYYDYENVTKVKDGKRVLTPLPSASILQFQAPQ